MKFLQNLFLLFAFIYLAPANAQPNDLPQQLWESYNEFREETISHRKFKHQDILPLIKKLEKNKDFEVNKIGKSIEGRDLFLISMGTGDIDVFLWSQMHGDESTATMAIFDIFNFLASNKFSAEKNELLKNVRLHFLPMLNPDGAEVFQRRNALGIDINRDALRLQSPEGQTLKRIRDSLDADFGFNLHDQSKYYNAQGTAKPATISFLAPAYNYEKEVNEVRANAMKVIVEMNEVLQRFAPGQVAKYNDDFEPRAFGDNIQKWGTSAILIESGGFPGDPEKQEIRKLNFVAILSALFSISNEGYKTRDITDYELIPENDSKLYDLKLTGLEYELLGDTYILDLGINHQEAGNLKNGFYYRANIADQGDLSTNYGYRSFDVTGYKVKWGNTYPTTIASMENLKKLDFKDLLRNGYSYVKVKNIPANVNFTSYPVQLIKENYKKPSRLGVGMNPTFFLEKDGKIEFAVINGFFHEIEKLDISKGNGLIIK
ncbi:MAG: M14 metallopeptidase family protein [Gillisia sp.]